MDAGERDAWREADRILDLLLDLPRQRQGDALAAMALPQDLQQRVAQLLAAQGHAGPLDHAPPPLALPATQPDALSGRQLGRWRLQHEIGRGGMAVVYRAQSVAGPAGQIAAVKVLSLGTIARSGHERILAEQRALLRLRHPYIAPLYEAGLAEDDTPWLAMALVEGQDIDTWCSEHALDVAARVRLVLQVAEALAYAHRNLVIHRDIKPSNVMVDSDGHVRLLDFGIARLSDAVAERTVTAMRALTPEYAAPEQVLGAPPSTSMDVYGLGALLYRLLTGQAPGADTTGANRRPPSRVVRADGGLAAHEREQRARRIHGDLDTILLKALAVQPEARYASVEAMAEDLTRWLQQRPIRARPPSWRYQVRKFVVRHRPGVAAVAGLLAVLIAGVSGTLWQARLARGEAERANAAAEQSQAQLAYLDSVLEVLVPTTQEAREMDRHQIVAEVAQRARRELATRPKLLASVELSLGQMAQRVGDYPRSLALYEAALRRRRAAFPAQSIEVAQALVGTGIARRLVEDPQHDLAARELDAALKILRRERPGSEELLRALAAMAVHFADDLPRAREQFAEAATICARGGTRAKVCESIWLGQARLLMRADHYAQAVTPLQHVWRQRRSVLGDEHASTLAVAGDLGMAYSRSGDNPRGLAMLERVHAIEQRIYTAPTVDTLATVNKLASLLTDMGQYRRAMQLRRHQLQQAQALFGNRHESVGLAFGNLGNALIGEGRFEEAAVAYRQGWDIYREIRGPAHPGSVIAQGNYADALREMGQPERALPMHRQALEGMRREFGERSMRTASRVSQLARTEAALGQFAPALRHYEDAIAMYSQYQPDNDPSAAMVRAHRSRTLLEVGRVAEAESEARAALEEITARVGAEHRFHWEALAMHLQAACAARHPDCDALRERLRVRLGGTGLSNGQRMKLQAALSDRRNTAKP